MHTLFLWTISQSGRSVRQHMIRSVEDLKDLLGSELRGRTFYLEARDSDDDHEVLDYYIRSSAEDVTEDDFRWLTAPVRGEVRGVRV